MSKYNTQQRKLMQDLFVAHPHEVFSAKEISKLLENDKVSISAVYRNLSELESSQFVRRCSKNGSREAYYQYMKSENCRDHIHLTCKMCGKTVHMESDDTDALSQKASEYRHFMLDKEETVLYGICEDCQTD